MAVVRWEPVRELDTIQSEMNRLFNTFFDTPTTAAQAAPLRRWMPPMDLVEDEDHFVLSADLPGMKQEDVRLEVSDGVLTIAGERTASQQEHNRGYIRIERATGSFQRSLALPDGVDPEQVAATFSDGVLEVRIPKPTERTPHRVQIAVNDGPRTLEGTASAQPDASAPSEGAGGPQAADRQDAPAR